MATDRPGAGAMPVPRHPPRPDRTTWRGVLGAGVVLFILTAGVMLATRNPNLYPTVTLIGSFLVPVTFVAFLVDHQHWSTLSFETIVRGFVLGGVLGILGASILEPLLLPEFGTSRGGPGMAGWLAVGVIEEGCKLAAVAWVARRLWHAGALDGLLLGAAVGMGFSALESSGYAFTVLMASAGNVPASLAEMVLRALLAPFGHGVWTAIVGAALFRDSVPGHFRVTARLALAFAFVAVLHAAWDGLNAPIIAVLPLGVPLSAGMVGASVLGLIVLAVVFRGSSRQQARLDRQFGMTPADAAADDSRRFHAASVPPTSPPA